MKLRIEQPEDRSLVASLLAQTYGVQGVQAIEIAAKTRQEDGAVSLVAEEGGSLKAFTVFVPLQVGASTAMLMAPLGVDVKDGCDMTELMDLLLNKAEAMDAQGILYHGADADAALMGLQKGSDIGCVEEKPMVEGALFVRVVEGETLLGRVTLPACIRK